MSDAAIEIPALSTAAEISAAVRGGQTTAGAVVQATLARIARLNPVVNALTQVTAERALHKAAAIDARLARGEVLGPLAGVAFTVKNLFDVAGVATLAGSKINADLPAASADATLVARLEAADAILVGCAGMGEFAYDFTGENAHHGATRNPHDIAHMSGGSSGGSGSSVASGMATFSLGSDTNGSIRVPSSLCGLFGLKPTYGRLSRAGTYPFVSSLDHLGPLARGVADLALAYDAMQGHDAGDPATTSRAPEPVAAEIDKGTDGLRIARAGGYFEQAAQPIVRRAVDTVAEALACTRSVELPEAGRARAAAFIITMAEGSALHLNHLRTRLNDFDPDVRDRLVAGAIMPSAWVVEAQKFRRWYLGAMLDLFSRVDAIIAPATPCQAPLLGQKMMTLGDRTLPVRANLGMFTQPISFIGLPVAAVPLWFAGETLPIGVQIIAAPWREDIVLRIARDLERRGICTTRPTQT